MYIYMLVHNMYIYMLVKSSLLVDFITILVNIIEHDILL